MVPKKNPISLPTPAQQVEFAANLNAARELFLLDALAQAVSTMDIPSLDKELARYIPSKYMRMLAAAGLRGELVFPVPILLKTNPRLLTYYRLLLGHSQKSFYQPARGTSVFKAMEDKGQVPASAPLAELCREMSCGFCHLMDHIGGTLTRDILDDLTLLTYGPQLRGGANVKRGVESIKIVFDMIEKIVSKSITTSTSNNLVLKNAAGRRVSIKFASDPDIVIRESLGANSERNVVAIEIKGGTDYSNIHNRVGEAEKSHQKARNAGYTECWTIVNVPNFDKLNIAKESPSTNKFYCLTALTDPTSTQYLDFKSRVLALTGLSDYPRRIAKRRT